MRREGDKAARCTGTMEREGDKEVQSGNTKVSQYQAETRRPQVQARLCSLGKPAKTATAQRENMGQDKACPRVEIRYSIRNMPVRES